MRSNMIQDWQARAAPVFFYHAVFGGIEVSGRTDSRLTMLRLRLLTTERVLDATVVQQKDGALHAH
jgi:hypothetical protein